MSQNQSPFSSRKKHGWQTESSYIQRIYATFIFLAKFPDSCAQQKVPLSVDRWQFIYETFRIKTKTMKIPTTVMI